MIILGGVDQLFNSQCISSMNTIRFGSLTGGSRHNTISFNPVSSPIEQVYRTSFSSATGKIVDLSKF
jgi:hypothetical protein